MAGFVMTRIRIATRRSKLALTQTRWVAAQLKAADPDLQVEEVHVVTKGDRVTDRPLAELGGKGLFVSEVEACVVRGEADLAVHSLKDVPGDVELAKGMVLACHPPREDPRDVLLTRDGAGLMDLEAGARVGTTSLRRIAQLRAHRPDLAFAMLRGNVDTRLARLDSGDFDAIILAAAGLHRLDLLKGHAHVALEPEICLPAVGQGTLAIETRADDVALRARLAPLECRTTRVATEAERALLKAMQGSCRVPMAGYAKLEQGGNRLRLDAMVGSIDGDQILAACGDIRLTGGLVSAHVEQAVALGREVAEGLISRGAQQLMRDAEATVLRREQEKS